MTEAPFVVTHASGLHAVARKLDDLHREALRIGGEAEDKSIRLSVLTLVAACTTPQDADLASATVGYIARSHPARAIVILANPDAADSIEADLRLQRGRTETGEICAEEVRLTVHGEPAYHLTSVVTPLLVPDVPVYLWLVGSPPLHQAFGDDAIALCERIIIDSGEYHDATATLQTMARELGPSDDALSLADLAWTRSRAWRRAIAQAFDGPEMRPLVRRITRVEVECSGDNVSSQAWLCGGWLSDRLGWKSEGGPYIVTSSNSTPDDVPKHDLTAVHITAVGNGHSATVTLERREETLYTTIDVDGGITASRVQKIGSQEVAHLVGGLLEETSGDPVYLHALRRGAELSKKAGK